MPLLDRVTTLIKANVNDLIDQAENPEKLLKQLLLDMQNQFVQVKTQLAIAIAGQHLLEKRQAENLHAQQDWVRKARLAIDKNEEDLARAALERSLSYENAAGNFAQQIEDQSHQVRMLRDALHRLEQKITETKAKAELLIAQHRRAKIATRSGTAAALDGKHDGELERLQLKITEAEAMAHGQDAVDAPSLDQRFTALERADQVERLLRELGSKAASELKSLSPSPS